MRKIEISGFIENSNYVQIQNISYRKNRKYVQNQNRILNTQNMCKIETLEFLTIKICAKYWISPGLGVSYFGFAIGE